MSKNLNFGIVINDLVIFFSVMMICLTILATTKTTIETEFTCNTGFIGLDMELNNYFENISKNNLTNYNNNFILEHLNIKNIDGFNCYGKGKFNIPLIYSNTLTRLSGTHKKWKLFYF